MSLDPPTQRVTVISCEVWSCSFLLCYLSVKLCVWWREILTGQQQEADLHNRWKRRPLLKRSVVELSTLLTSLRSRWSFLCWYHSLTVRTSVPTTHTHTHTQVRVVFKIIALCIKKLKILLLPLFKSQTVFAFFFTTIYCINAWRFHSPVNHWTDITCITSVSESCFTSVLHGVDCGQVFQLRTIGLHPTAPLHFLVLPQKQHPTLMHMHNICCLCREIRAACLTPLISLLLFWTRPFQLIIGLHRISSMHVIKVYTFNKMKKKLCKEQRGCRYFVS